MLCCMLLFFIVCDDSFTIFFVPATSTRVSPVLVSQISGDGAPMLTRLLFCAFEAKLGIEMDKGQIAIARCHATTDNGQCRAAAKIECYCENIVKSVDQRRERSCLDCDISVRAKLGPSLNRTRMNLILRNK